MATTIKMPQLGESVTEGTIERWLVKEGDHVDQYDPLFEVVTDKVNAEVPAEVAGTVTKIIVPDGETVKVGTPLAEIDVEGDGAGTTTPQAAEPASTEAPAAEAPSPQAQAGEPQAQSGPPQAAEPPAGQPEGEPASEAAAAPIAPAPALSQEPSGAAAGAAAGTTPATAPSPTD